MMDADAVWKIEELAREKPFLPKIKWKTAGFAQGLGKLKVMPQYLRGMTQDLVGLLDEYRDRSQEAALIRNLLKCEEAFISEFITQALKCDSVNEVNRFVGSFFVQKNRDEGERMKSLVELLPDCVEQCILALFSPQGTLSYNCLWQVIEQMVKYLFEDLSSFLLRYCRGVLLENVFADELAGPVQLRQLLTDLLGNQTLSHSLRYLNQTVYRLEHRHRREVVNNHLGTYYVRLVKAPNDYQGGEDVNEQMNYKVICNGIDPPTRRSSDNLVIIGKEGLKITDIKLPDADPRIELVTALIINFTEYITYLVDLSTTGNVLFSLRPVNSPHQIALGTILKFAHSLIAEVIAIDVIDNSLEESELEDETEFQTLHSVLILKFLTQPYEGNSFTLRTKVKDSDAMKTEFLVGRGGGGHMPDLFLPQETGASKLHAKIFYHEQAWFIQDAGSLHGTYIGLKTAEQFKNRVPSTELPLFGTIPNSDNEIEISIGNYRFQCVRERF